MGTQQTCNCTVGRQERNVPERGHGAELLLQVANFDHDACIVRPPRNSLQSNPDMTDQTRTAGSFPRPPVSTAPPGCAMIRHPCLVLGSLPWRVSNRRRPEVAI